MFTLRHFAAPTILGAALFLGVQGCTNERKDMPGNAQLMSEGRETVSTTAPHDGTVYLYDDSSRKTIYSGRVNKGDNIRLDARDNKVMFNDRVAVSEDLPNSHKYQIYFDRNEAGDMAVPARQREGETVVQPSQSGTTITQPSGTNTTVIPPAPPAQPAPTNNTTVIPPAPAPANNATGNQPYGQPNAQPNVQPSGQPNGTVVQPNPSGSSTITTPPAR